MKIKKRCPLTENSERSPYLYYTLFYVKKQQENFNSIKNYKKILSAYQKIFVITIGSKYS